MEIEPIQEEPMAVESGEGNLQGQLSIEFRDKAALYQEQPSKNVQSGMDSPLITALRSREPTADPDSEQFSYKELTKTVFSLDAPQQEQQELQPIPAVTASPPVAVAPAAAASAQPVAHRPASRSVSRSPTKRATSPTKRVSSPTRRNTHKVVLPATSAATSEDEGLQFLLRACELLEPEEEAAAAALLMSGLKQRGQSNQDLSDGGSQRLVKRPAAVRNNNNRSSQRRRNSSDVSDLEDDHDVMNSYLAKGNTTNLTRSNSGSDGASQGDDADYRPSNSRRPARKAASGARAVIQAAAAAAAAVSPTGHRDQDRYPYAPAVKGAPSKAGTGGRNGGGDSHRVANPTGGPCMNPECEHPFDSPQWRKGPPQAPVLCNACGTRFLRNGTLKPICPKRGIRYGKDGKPTRMVSSSGGSSASTSPMKQGAAAGARGGLGSGLGGRAATAAAATAGSVLESSGVAALMAAAEQQQQQQQQQQPQASLNVASSNPAIAAAMQYEQFLSSWLSMQKQAQQQAQLVQQQQQQVQQQQPMELKTDLSMSTDMSLGEKSESEGASGRLRPVFSLTAVAGPAIIAAPAALNISIAAPAALIGQQQQDAMEIDGQ